MAFESPGFANSGGTATYTAEQTRRALFAVHARTSANAPGIITGGLLGAADLQLTAPGSGLSVNVGTGECVVGGSEGASQGGYYAKNNATVNLSIAAANPSNPRVDTVCVTISDSSYTEPTGGSGNQVAAQVVTGTPTSGANVTPGSGGYLAGAAALPLSSLLLGYVLVPAAASNIVTADILNAAGPAQIGLQPAIGRAYEWSYTQITSPVGIASTSESSPTTIISPAAFTPDGQPVMVEFFCPVVSTDNNALGNYTMVALYEGATEIGRLAESYNVNTSQEVMPSIVGRYRFTPTAASHTYTIGAFAQSTVGSPTINAGPGGSAAVPPAFVRFTKV